MLPRTTRQRGIARGEKYQMIEIRTGQTQSALLSRQHNPCLAAQMLPTLITLRLSRRDEYLQFSMLAPLLIHAIHSDYTLDGFQRKKTFLIC